MTSPADVPVRILIINPNTSQNMTDALKPVVEQLGYKNVQYTLFTSPTPGIPSINSPSDAAQSATICLPHLIPHLPQHDAFLVACYSAHPLVAQLKHECELLSRAATQGSGGVGARKHVTGIFEASVCASLGVVGGTDGEGFGIVSTGKIWEEALGVAVGEMLGGGGGGDGQHSGVSVDGKWNGYGRFVGCTTTGLNASELHDLPGHVVREKMKGATKRLLGEGARSRRDVRAVCLGCAGMVGLEEAVREACVEELGGERGKGVAIVDGVKAGVGMLVMLARGGF